MKTRPYCHAILRKIESFWWKSINIKQNLRCVDLWDNNSQREIFRCTVTLSLNGKIGIKWDISLMIGRALFAWIQNQLLSAIFGPAAPSAIFISRFFFHQYKSLNITMMGLEFCQKLQIQQHLFSHLQKPYLSILRQNWRLRGSSKMFSVKNQTSATTYIVQQNEVILNFTKCSALKKRGHFDRGIFFLSRSDKIWSKPGKICVRITILSLNIKMLETVKSVKALCSMHIWLPLTPKSTSQYHAVASEKS